MKRLLAIAGRRLLISKRHKSVRQSLIYLLTHIFFAGVVIFIIELLLIFLGISNISIPLNTRAISILSQILF